MKKLFIIILLIIYSSAYSVNEDYLLKIYLEISERFNIGTLSEFTSKMQTIDDRKKFYDLMAYNKYHLGSYENYEDSLQDVVYTDVAVDWEESDLRYIVTSSSNQSYYVKISTIKKPETYSTEYKFWVYVYPQIGYEKQCRDKLYKSTKNVKYLKYDYEKILYYVKCNKEEIGLKVSVVYDKSGDIIENNDSYYPDYSVVIPDTVGDDIYKFVCDYIKSDKFNSK